MCYKNIIVNIYLPLEATGENDLVYCNVIWYWTGLYIIWFQSRKNKFEKWYYFVNNSCLVVVNAIFKVSNARLMNFIELLKIRLQVNEQIIPGSLQNNIQLLELLSKCTWHLIIIELLSFYFRNVIAHDLIFIFWQSK